MSVAHPSPPSGTLLVVDDELGIRDFLRFALEPMGLGIEVAPDGEEALRRIAEREFDLVILDVHMPRMSGPEVLARIHQLRPRQKVLLTSSSSDSTHASEKQAIDAGALGCLFKPFELEELIAALERALERSLPYGSRASPSVKPVGGDASAPRAGVERSQKTRATLLVVDDEPGIREMLSFELTQEGFDVETAEDGMAAVECVRRRKFDVTITDLKMPGMDGAATVEALRAVDPEMEVVVATGYASVETAVACMKRGAYDYIQKPYDLNELKLLLERAVQKSHLQGTVALYQASRALLATLQRGDLVRLVVQSAQKVLHADDAGLLLRWQEGGASEIHRLDTAGGLTDALLSELAQKAEEGGAPLLFPSRAGAPADAGWKAYGSALVFPLSARDRSLGALAVVRRRESPGFSQSELQKGVVFSGQAALSLDNSRLYDDVAQRLSELIKTREQLVQAEKLALAGQLARSIAHEINNPLTFIQANLEFLRRHFEVLSELSSAARSAAGLLRERPDPAVHEVASRLSDAAGSEDDTEGAVRDIGEALGESLDGIERIAHLISGFRQLAAPEATGKPERVDVDAMIEECITVWNRHTDRPVHIQRKDRSICEALIARVDLRSALFNLIAFFYAPERIRSRKEGAVTLWTEHQEKRPCIVISDDRLWLSEQERGQIFDPRLEVDTSHGRTIRLNLELALTYQILRRSGAEISSVADPHRGLTFRILLAAPPLPLDG